MKISELLGVTCLNLRIRIQSYGDGSLFFGFGQHVPSDLRETEISSVYIGGKPLELVIEIE